MASRLRAKRGQVELVEYPRLDRYLDASAARTAMLRKTDEFLRTAWADKTGAGGAD